LKQVLGDELYEWGTRISEPDHAYRGYPAYEVREPH